MEPIRVGVVCTILYVSQHVMLHAVFVLPPMQVSAGACVVLAETLSSNTALAAVILQVLYAESAALVHLGALSHVST